MKTKSLLKKISKYEKKIEICVNKETHKLSLVGDACTLINKVCYCWVVDRVGTKKGYIIIATTIKGCYRCNHGVSINVF